MRTPDFRSTAAELPPTPAVASPPDAASRAPNSKIGLGAFAAAMSDALEDHPDPSEDRDRPAACPTAAAGPSAAHLGSKVKRPPSQPAAATAVQVQASAKISMATAKPPISAGSDAGPADDSASPEPSDSAPHPAQDPSTPLPDGSVASAAANIIPFPLLTPVIIPFPAMAPVPASSSSGDGSDRTSETAPGMGEAATDAGTVLREGGATTWSRPALIALPTLPGRRHQENVRATTPVASSQSSQGSPSSAEVSGGDPLTEVEIDVNWPGWNPGTGAQAQAQAERGSTAAGLSQTDDASHASAANPAEPAGSTAGNIVAVEFRAANSMAAADLPQASGLAGAAGSGPADVADKVVALEGQLHLPGAEVEREETAGLKTVRKMERGDAGTLRAVKSRIGAASGAAGLSLQGGGEAGGTAAAQNQDRMGSLMNSDQRNAAGAGHGNAEEEASGTPVKVSQNEVRVEDLKNAGAVEWQTEQPVGTSDRPSSSLNATDAGVSPAATVDRLAKLVLQETCVARRHASDSMSVILRPDEGTELFVHFTQRNGIVQATIRCERGDFHQLNALWLELQSSLAEQKISLGPLQEASSGYSGSNGSSNKDLNWSGQEAGTNQRQSSQRQSLDEWPTPASSDAPSARLRGRRGSGARLTTSRPGWETWA